MKEKGITLIALVITIIVLLILSGVSIAMITGENGILKYADKAKLVTELSQIKEEIELKNAPTNEKNTTQRYMTTKEVSESIPNIPQKYKGKVGIYREKTVYLGDENDETTKTAKDYGYKIINMTEDEFTYYIEMGILEDNVKNSKDNKIGRELATQEFPDTIKIGKNTYSNGWYLIGNYNEEEKNNGTYNGHYDELNLKHIKHAPYIVNYETGSVLSVNGMIMYKAKIPIHTFQDNNFKLINAISYIDDMSIKTDKYYGNLYSTNFYKGPVHDNLDLETIGIYKDNNGQLQYDENGALLLDENNAIPVLELDRKYTMDEAYSINVTLEGDIYQAGDYVGNFSTIVALSDRIDEYTSIIGYYKGYLHIYSFRGEPKHYIEYEKEEKGFASIDISKYAGQRINIQVVAERNKETKVYINGELIKTFQSGSEKFSYNYATLGDLRVGRNLKFKGKIYNFAIYGVALTEKEIKENYEASK